MELQKYDGNIHPDEWINDLRTYFNINPSSKDVIIAISLVDPTIKLSTDINSFEKLRNELKEDSSFTVFKNANKRKLQLLKYIPGCDTLKFVTTFRKLCYNGEINNIEEQKKYLFKTLPISNFNDISNEFHVKMKNVSSLNELIKGFEDIILEKSNIIKSGSVVALKHVATGKYLSSIKNLHYTTGSKKQLVFAGSSDFNLNSLWNIEFNGEFATSFDTFALRHIKSSLFLGINWGYSSSYHKSPSTNHTEVSCDGNEAKWNFRHSKLENDQVYLKSNDIINLGIEKKYDDDGNKILDGPTEFLRSHDIQFTIRNDAFQEVVCHNERLGGNDVWCIEFIKEHTWSA
ncbi:unnamed protein product [Rhizophagus irregularis]|uniref:MIR domain-containing protein n=1 Tax=Rhizophagus irregularis TaxID=588596 RepID=A0A2N1NSZ6_9GLOM|nr:hypothetical protein RhiirC2_844667 [Rhizophagus irregularis]CAB4388957.1 unnamed protein product [Rhizophagus irregularis]CAB5384801.1 unnamed protein product [Rhizophagus irregularis]